MTVHEGDIPSDLERGTLLEDVIDDLAAAGGKLLRPRMIYLGYLSACVEASSDTFPTTSRFGSRGDLGEQCMRSLVRLGAGAELLHIFGLVQDDVMDEAPTRRGSRSAYVALADAGGRAGMGSSLRQRFGESLAVLAGDLAFALAARQVRDLGPAVCDEWDDMVIELVQGQRLDVVYAADGRFGPDGAQWVSMAKSGAYSVLRPLRLGALVRGHVPAWLEEYGFHTAVAFAMADDLLGVWGEPEVTGKPVGHDLWQAKPSLVMGVAHELMGDSLSQLLIRCRRNPSDLPVLMDELRHAGVRQEAERRLEEHLSSALAALEQCGDVRVREQLESVAHTVARRTA